MTLEICCVRCENTLLGCHKAKHFVKDMRVVTFVLQHVTPQKLIDSERQLVTTRQPVETDIVFDPTLTRTLHLTRLQYGSMLFVHTPVLG